MCDSYSINRRGFIATGAVALGAFMTVGFNPNASYARGIEPQGPLALPLDHFPSKLHALIWRNWNLVPIARLAKTIQATVEQINSLAVQMKLPAYQEVSLSQWNRSYLTVIRRNWHLLPKSQLLVLLDWTEEQLEFTLVEDDFFYIKLGSLKPHCEPIYWNAIIPVLDNSKVQLFQKQLNSLFPKGIPKLKEPYFQFVKDLSKPIIETSKAKLSKSAFSPKIAYPYFALFGDPLLSDSNESYPDAYLERMQEKGVDSIWMHIVLSKLSPFPWDLKQSEHWEKRLENLAKLAKRTNEKGIKIFLYLNEPRNQTQEFFNRYPHLQGSGMSLCTSIPEVQEYLTKSISLIAEKVPGLGGFFSITASENPTNCWSHYAGDKCKRCGPLGAAKVISDLNSLYLKGIKEGYEKISKHQIKNQEYIKPKLIVWDWGWQDGLPEGILPNLKSDSLAFMSVSEWNLPIERGGVKSQVGEYSISSIGPGPRASKHWKIARENNIPCVAKIQANNSWEIAAVPYIPALYNVGQHISNLRKADVSGIMLGWSLGGYPSPNLELVALLGENQNLSIEDAIQQIAKNRFGTYGKDVAKAWYIFSMAFREFPYNGSVVYNAPLQAGSSNLLWKQETGYKATMVGLPYDDLTSWRSIYPEDIFIQQLGKVCDGFSEGIKILKELKANIPKNNPISSNLNLELHVAEVVFIHYKSIINQSRFIINRRKLQEKESQETKNEIIKNLQSEIDLSMRLAEIQSKDSRIGFEASNHYFYVPHDLYEKVLNCNYLIEHYKG